jgi:hypothetical protein
MALGKNAKKRAARRAFHDVSDASAGKIPYALHVIIHRDGKAEKVIFASLSSYKEYRARFYESNPQGVLILESDMSKLDDSKGKSNRSRVMNLGIGQNKGKESRPMQAPSKRRFAKDGFVSTDFDALRSIYRDVEKDRAIKAEETQNPTYQYSLKMIREKYRNI